MKLKLVTWFHRALSVFVYYDSAVEVRVVHIYLNLTWDS